MLELFVLAEGAVLGFVVIYFATRVSAKMSSSTDAGNRLPTGLM